MKIYLVKHSALIFALFLVFTVSHIREVSAQTIGGGVPSNLESAISGKLRGKIGGGVFASLGASTATPTPKRPKKRPATSAKTSNTKSQKSTTPLSKSKPPAKTASVNTQNEEIEDYNYDEVLTYQPIGNLNTAEKLVNEFGTNASEKELLRELFRVVKVAYDIEAEKKGKNNDVALAMTFFIATCVTVYHDVPEPDDQAFDNLYETLAGSLIEDEQFAATSDRTKQEISESLIYISGLILGGYMNGKENVDQDTISVFRTLAGVSLLSLTQLDPGKMRFDQNGLVVEP